MSNATAGPYQGVSHETMSLIKRLASEARGRTSRPQRPGTEHSKSPVSTGAEEHTHE